MNTNPTPHRWRERRRRHTGAGSSGSSGRASLKVGITSIPNATAWGGGSGVDFTNLVLILHFLEICH